MNFTDTLKKRLANLNLSLPDLTTPGGNYQSVNVRGNMVYIAIQFPIIKNEFLYTGYLGKDLSTEEGYQAAQLCALNVISQIHYKIGIEKIAGINHFDLYYQSDSIWDEAPDVANGASDLFVNVLQEKGQHTRAIIGAANLPRNFSVGLVSTFTLV
ncbi:MAG: RidA family protein [Cyclobacteriaceae bacterium]|nr:RidA family protein [Cyclobacteriaceae bacterium]